ncbi:dispanin subfamily A member 2b [Bombina bombina]|uniref:dispanin subfamily A member 2b n=1 Tax=Bombina bombina TaxID=8345 RepID=UPI00235A9617|nr:dispanin subfamily A member 2b [Bombina bombina]
MESNYPRQMNAPVSGTGAPPQYNESYQPLNEELKSMSRNQVPATVVTISANEIPVRDHLVWSIFNMFYMNFCCLGLIALVFSVKSRDRKLFGDRNGAVSYGSTSRSLNIAATVLSVLFFVILFILVVTGVIGMANQVHKQYNTNFENFGK